MNTAKLTQRVPRWFAIVSAVVLAFLIAIVWKNGEEKAAAEKAAKLAAAAAEAAENAKLPPVEITAVDLHRGFLTNELAIKEALGKHPVIVVGRVIQVHDDFSGKGVVVMQTLDPATPARMVLADGQRSLAAKLKAGQSVEARCVSIGFGLGIPMGRDCRLPS